MHYDRYAHFEPKKHTIRAGNRWKVGDKFSPRIWSERPYRSPQIKICDDIEVVKVYKFEMKPALFFDECQFYVDGNRIIGDDLELVALNDGLSIQDFICWFAGPMLASSTRKPFNGQIICWDNNVDYERIN